MPIDMEKVNARRKTIGNMSLGVGCLALLGTCSTDGTGAGGDGSVILPYIFVALPFLLLGAISWGLIGFDRFLEKQGSHIRETAKWQAQREQEAEAVAAGAKPFGAPWSATHGGAFFMRPRQVEQAGHGFTQLNRNIPFLGAQAEPGPDGKAVNLRYIQFNAPGHVLTAAPTRSGKGTTAVIPNLLTYRGPVVVNDIKGENFEIAGRRRERMGQEVFRFAPFDENTCRWNPMDRVSEFPDIGREDAALLADMLLIPTGGAEATYFEDRARNFLTGVILHVAMTCQGEQRSLAHVRHLLTLPRADFNALLDDMAASEAPAVVRAANLLRDGEDKQREQITATLDSQMAIWDSEALADVMSGRSDFTLADLKTLDTPISVFFEIPPEKLNQYKPLLRVFFGQAVREMSQNPEVPDPPVLFLLDEFPALGRMRPIEDAIPYLAGYGARMWLFAQDLSQIRNAYGDGADTILANCGCWQFFGVNDMTTARMVSEMTGQTTVSTVNRSAEPGWMNPTPKDPKHPQYSINQTARPLMSPDEVTSINEDLELVFIQGLRPIRCEKVPYHIAPSFQRLYNSKGGMPPPQMPKRHRRRRRDIHDEAVQSAPDTPAHHADDLESADTPEPDSAHGRARPGDDREAPATERPPDVVQATGVDTLANVLQGATGDPSANNRERGDTSAGEAGAGSDNMDLGETDDTARTDGAPSASNTPGPPPRRPGRRSSGQTGA